MELIFECLIPEPLEKGYSNYDLEVATESGAPSIALFQIEKW